MKNIKIWYLLLSCLFYFTVTIEGMEIVAYAFYYALPFCYICLHLNIFKKLINTCLQSSMKYFFIAISLLAIGALLIPILHQTYDFTYFNSKVLSLAKELIRIVFLLLVFLKHISPEGDYKLFIKYFLLSCCCYVLFTVILILFPDFKMFLYGIIKEGEHAKVVALQSDYVTRYGWAGFSGFGHTFVCTLGVALALFLILNSVKQNHFDLYIICGILLLGNMFYGRSGLLVSLVILSLFIFILLHKRAKTFTILLSICIFLIFVLLILAFTNDQVNIWFNWAFAIFINFFKTGKLQTVSSNILFDKMIFYPGFKTLLVGDGMYSVGELYYLNTDVGFMRPTLFGGFLFLLISYACLWTILWTLLKKKKLSTPLARKFLLCALLIVFILFEIKGEIVNAMINNMFGIIILVNYYFMNKHTNGGINHE